VGKETTVNEPLGLDKDRCLLIEDAVSGPSGQLAVFRDLAPVAFFPNDVFRVIESQRMQHVPRIDIVTLCQDYQDRGLLDVHQCGRGFVWLDTSTHEHINAAARFIEAIETSQGFKIACLEEIALRKGYISAERLADIAQDMNSEYGSYLRSLLP